MSKSTSFYPSMRVSGDGAGVVSQAGVTLLLAAVAKTGLGRNCRRR